MTTLYVTSIETFSGKSAVCVGFARRFQRDGVRFGYMKPVSTGARLGAGSVDEDARYFRQAFALPDAPDDIAPIALGQQAVARILEGQEQIDWSARLLGAYGRVSPDRDVVILEGGCSLHEGALIDMTPPRVADLLSAREIVVIRYSDDLQLFDEALIGQACFGDSCIGVIANSVPRQHMPFVQETIKPALERRGVQVLAVLPQERLLQSMSVREMVEILDGELLCGEANASELVEHLMVGAMGVESALGYFRRKPNKAVITGGDRSDIQLAALETSTRCIILTGGLRPSPIILARAEELGVPMVVVHHDTLTAVETIERHFGKTRFWQDQKVERFEEMLADRFDFGKLYVALGLRS